MEEDKAAAYYEELTRKGGGAARFKQGLGFSTSDSNDRGSSSSSFLNNFVRASSPTHASKQAQLQSIQSKLKKKKSDSNDNISRSSTHSHRHRSRSRERDRDRDRHSRRRSRDRDRDRDRARDSRSGGVRNLAKDPNVSVSVDYTRLIQGYDKMTPAERVKAKMKLQLAETADKDETKGSGWERFEFDKDAPLDDEEIEAADDDTALVKHIGQSFRFSAVEARREDQIRAAHDEAMFGAPVCPMSTTSSDSEPEGLPNNKEDNETGPVTNLISEKVLAKQQGSWRDRARKM